MATGIEQSAKDCNSICACLSGTNVKGAVYIRLLPKLMEQEQFRIGLYGAQQTNNIRLSWTPLLPVPGIEQRLRGTAYDASLIIHG